MAGRRKPDRKPDDGYLRETFTLPRDKARMRAREFLNRYPKAAYMSSVESWRELPGGDIEFTMRRLTSADQIDRPLAPARQNRENNPMQSNTAPHALLVMPGLVPGIHAFLLHSRTWMAGTSPAMTDISLEGKSA